ncbi:MAG: hypothetical protein M3O74_10500 [Pseudomonadota bacterium]|jgi:hypothetical protein|nr:hypothetical protein [Pseudomonadota bacterium]
MEKLCPSESTVLPSQDLLDSEAQFAAERVRVRELLRTDHGVKSMFVRVQSLSRILGIPAATIYGAMREGRFFLPHRLIFSAPVVKFEDLVDWCCQPTEFKRPEAKDERLASPQVLAVTGERLDISQASAMKALARDFREAVISEALAKMNH